MFKNILEEQPNWLRSLWKDITYSSELEPISVLENTIWWCFIMDTLVFIFLAIIWHVIKV